MPKKIKCPDEKWFVRLAESRVTKEQEEKLAHHLESCKRCQLTVDELNDISAYTPNPVHDGHTEIDSDSRRLQERLSEIKAQTPQVSAESGYMDVMPWLQVSETMIAQVDEFELQEFIGRGGMGVVFKCLDTKLERLVAIKLMSPQLLVDESARERFLREARSAAKINHLNVVTIHSVNETQGLPYLVMELVDGDSLESTLAKRDSLPFHSIVQIARQSIAGLSAAHRQGVLHRDIKPANIMLDSQSGQAKITDFGLACSMEGSKLTRTGFLVGTPDYLSPEQAAGGQIDERSDLFSMGSVVYAMCSGASPFSSSSLMTTLDNVRSKQPNNLQELNPGLPTWFVTFIEKLLQKLPEHRFKSASEALADIDAKETKSNQTTFRIDVSSTQKVAKRKRGQQQKLLLASSLFTVAVCLLIATIAWWFHTHNNEPARITEQQNNVEKSTNQIEDLRKIDTRELIKGNSFVVHTAEQLFAVIAEPQPEINILIPSGAEFELPQRLDIEGKDVTIATNDLEPARWKVGIRDDVSIRVVNATLSLENLIVWSPGENEEFDDDDGLPLIYCEESSVELNRIRIACHNVNPCIEMEDSTAEIVNSQLFSKETAILWLPIDEDQQLTIENSIVAAPFPISARSEDQVNVDLLKSTLMGESCLIAGFVRGEGQLSLHAEDSILFSTESLVDIDEFGDDETDWELKDLLKKIELSGSNNRLSPQLIGGEYNEMERTIAVNFKALNRTYEDNRLLAFELDEETDIDDLVVQFLDGEFGVLAKLASEGVGAKLNPTDLD